MNSNLLRVVEILDNQDVTMREICEELQIDRNTAIRYVKIIKRKSAIVITQRENETKTRYSLIKDINDTLADICEGFGCKRAADSLRKDGNKKRDGEG